MTKNILRRLKVATSRVRRISLINAIITLGVIVFVLTGAAWLYHTQNNADRVFWGMVENNLNTSSFAREIISENGAQVTKQVVQTQTSPNQISHSKTDISYAGDTTTEIKTETIGTPTHDYVRYTHIQTEQKSTSGKDLDFTKLLNIWGKSTSTPEGKADGVFLTNGQQYNEAVLAVVPFGDLKASDRKALIKKMRDTGVYTVRGAETKHEGLLRRPQHTIEVQVKTDVYIGILQEYARIVGLNHLKDLDAKQYASARPVTVKFVVDGWSRQIRQVGFGAGSRSEKISSYNSVRAQPKEPTDTIPVEELQSKLQSIQ